MKLEYLSAKQLGDLINDRTLKPLEVIRYFEDRIEKRNKSINAFVYTQFDYAEKEAIKLEKRLNLGEYIGPFAGVPFALKDFLPNKIGWQSSHGGVECLISIDKYNSVFCEAMEEAGGIAVGKTNAPAYGFRGTTDNKLYGPTSTPFNIKYNSGGSSGGSAAAVADGLVPIAEGGDAGGSIRIPAAWCNLFGYKPSVGTIPNVCRPDAWSATHPFCFNFGLTKTVEDAAILLSYMSQYNPRDPFSYQNQYIYPTMFNVESSSKAKIAVTYDFNLFEIDLEIKNSIDKAIDIFRSAGYVVDFVDFNFKYSANDIANSWCNSLMFDSVIEIEQDKKSGKDYLLKYPDQFPEEMLYWENKSKDSDIWDLYNFNLIRTDILDQFENVFEKYDYILSPVSCCLPVLNKENRNTKGPENLNGKPVESLIGWTQTYLVNMVGYPAASLPIDISKNNLPIGIQLIGRKFNDQGLLLVCKDYEYVNPWKDNYEICFNRKVDYI